MTNRETAHYISEKESRGCTLRATRGATIRSCACRTCTSSRARPGSPTPEEIIADTKDGVLIDGRGSYSIDQQRYNGQFGGNAFWEIKNGKKTRMVTNVTYNAITTDFWGNLDAITGQGVVADARHRRRRQGPADADQQHLARLAVPPHQEDPAFGALRFAAAQLKLS